MLLLLQSSVALMYRHTCGVLAFAWVPPGVCCSSWFAVMLLFWSVLWSVALCMSQAVEVSQRLVLHLPLRGSEGSVGFTDRR